MLCCQLFQCPLTIDLWEIHNIIYLHSSLAFVSIEVEDVNDNSPEFIDEPYETEISEVYFISAIQLGFNVNYFAQGFNSSAGAYVYLVQARDVDSGANGMVRYSLAGRGSESFVVNPESGEIRVSTIEVDFETIPGNPLMLNVIASDLGMHNSIQVISSQCAGIILAVEPTDHFIIVNC